jgi:large repetitive protein
MRLVRLLVITAALGLVLVPSASALRFTDDSYLVPVGVVGQDYSHRFEGDGGCGPALAYQFRVLSGALPPGLSLSGDGLLVGVPTQAGSWSFWLELSDEDPPSERWCLPRKSERLFTVDILPAVSVTAASAPAATLGIPYSLALSAQGGSGTRTWSIASGQLPPGLALNAATGEITGSPSAAGVYEFRVRVSDGSRLGSTLLRIPVREPLAVQAPEVHPSEVGVPITLKLAASGGSATKAWRLEGALPRGLTLDAASGAIAGTPESAGQFPVRLVVSDTEGRSAEVDLAIEVSPRLAIASTRLEAARIGRQYRARIRTLGGVGPLTFKVLAGRVPAGVRLDTRSGALTGKPRTTGTHRLVIEGRDKLGAAARRTFVLAVR